MAMPLYTSAHVSISLPITKNCIKSYHLTLFYYLTIHFTPQRYRILFKQLQFCEQKKASQLLCTCATVITHTGAQQLASENQQ